LICLTRGVCLQRFDVTFIADAVLYNLHTTVRRLQGGGTEAESTILLRALIALQKEGKVVFEFALDSFNHLTAVWFATPAMLQNFAVFGELVVVDATCKTNRFVTHSPGLS
jgi:hypothetical protein